MSKPDIVELAVAAEEAQRFIGRVGNRKVLQAAKGAAVYLLTSAQNNTPVHAKLWRNLLAYAEHRGARLLVSRFAYNKAGFQHVNVKPGTEDAGDLAGVHYAPEIAAHIFDDRLAITPSLVFCGETNIIPTQVHPLTGFENYTGRASGIYPHAKQEMRSIPALNDTKFNYSTGTVTQRNYIQRGAGLRAEYGHAYGALIVEVDADGTWFVRQIRAIENGSFQDLDCVVFDGVVHTDRRVEAIQWGDIHVDSLDPDVRRVNWGEGGMLDALRPTYQFMHDTLDFQSRNHHDAKNWARQYVKHRTGGDSVGAELARCVDFFREVHRPFCKTIVVSSNHDLALRRWLEEADYRTDPKNASTFLTLQVAYYEAMTRGQPFNAFKFAMRHLGLTAKHPTTFLAPDESFLTCKAAGGIENGLHGHDGANGGRGSSGVFAKIGRRTNTGHAHSACIDGDNFTAGTSSRLRLPYTKGLSSWSHTHIATYPNGCRTLITLRNGRYRGQQ